MYSLADKETLLKAIAEQIEMINQNSDAHYQLLDKFSPTGSPSGLIFSQAYKPLVQKRLFQKNRYYILIIKCGEAELNGYLGHVTQWCDTVFEFKNKVDFYNYLEYIKLCVNRKNSSRITLESIQTH